MKFLELNTVSKDYFGYEDIASALGITPAAAKVFAHRYVKNKILIRAKRGIYILREKWNHFSREQKFEIANLLQVPSYISLATAMDYYEITTQMQKSFIESIAIKRTKEFDINGTVFNYTRINRNLYNGFLKQNNFFIATPEKALLDASYLMSLGRYKFDTTVIDLNKVNRELLLKEAKRFPEKTQNFMENHGYFSTT
jgi:predicted transcriptional regulator of viral defense system